jgi:LysM repeat protein
MSKGKIVLYLATVAALLAGCTVSYSNPPTGAATGAFGSSTQSHDNISPAEATMNAIRAAFFTQTAQAHEQNGGSTTPLSSGTAAFATVSTTETTPGVGTTQTPQSPNTPITTFPAVPTATPGLPAKYTIHEGETAWCLARRFDIDPADLLEANGLPSDYQAMPNDILKIPTGASPFPGDRALHDHTANMQYTVKSGQTNVYYVACYFGDVDPNAIIVANALKEPYDLTAGRVVTIP